MLATNVKPCDILQGLLQQAGVIGGVQEHQVELLAAAQIGQGVAVPDPGPVRKSAQLQVLPDQLQGGGAFVHKNHLQRAPAQGFDAQLAGAAEQVQYPAALDVELQDGEHALLDLVGGGTDVHALGLLQAAAPGGSGDDSHIVIPSDRSTRRSPGSPGPRRLPSPLSFGWSS